MKMSNQNQKQPTIQATTLPIERLTDAEMAALAGGIFRPFDPPGPRGPDDGKRRGPETGKHRGR